MHLAYNFLHKFLGSDDDAEIPHTILAKQLLDSFEKTPMPGKI